MKQLLLFMSMVFLFLGTSCQNKELIAEGELTAITENTATIDGVSYPVENGTTDFFFKDKIKADGSHAFIYKSGGKLHVSRLNQNNISDFSSFPLGWSITFFFQTILFCGLSLYLSCNSIKKLDDNDKGMLTFLNCLVIVPVCFFILSKAFPKSTEEFSTRYEVNFIDYGTLTNLTDESKTINGRTWISYKDYPANSSRELFQVGSKYAVIKIDGALNFYKTDDVVTLKRELAYARLHPQNLVFECLIVFFSLGGLFWTLWINSETFRTTLSRIFHKKKNKPESELSHNDRYGHGYVIKE